MHSTFQVNVAALDLDGFDCNKNRVLRGRAGDRPIVDVLVLPLS